ncbi:MAG: ATP-dependent helicase RhlE [Miltoncostaeaceae bacterium]|nr:ATP-dependent helicase RhlE [Miltoncostaeaceae bacterium]
MLAALAARGIETPFPVQTLVVREVLNGRDVMVQSPTGSGKTLAFGLPMIEMLEPGGARPGALVLAPTRELASQIEDELGALAAARGIRVAVAYGGMDIAAQAKAAAVSELLVATPGRLLDLVRRRLVSLDDVQTLVLDEADRMLDMGFLPQVRDIVRRVPADRQTMFFSATLDGEVGGVAAEFTRSPTRLRLNEAKGSEDSLSMRLEHAFVATTSHDKLEALMALIADEEDSVLVFCRTKRGAARVAERLSKEKVGAGALHGDLTQSARERALRRFTDGRPRVMVATDVASRGIDLDDIGLVVNYDPPNDRDTYTHRVGRTARAGREGRAVTLVLPDQVDEVGRIAMALGLDEAWAETGYDAVAPRVVYTSRRRGSVFAPTRQRSTGTPAPETEGAPRRNRVPRGSRSAVSATVTPAPETEGASRRSRVPRGSRTV